VLVAKVILGLLAAHLVLGALFGAWFLARGLRRMDPAASHAPLGFKILIFPGVVALWPLLAWHPSRRIDHPGRPDAPGRGPDEADPADWAMRARRRHRRMWLALALLLPLGFIAGLLARPAASPAQHSVNPGDPPAGAEP
jgi:uncharacterized membrane protein YphA (DoxX/SURF4 family)